MAEGAEAWCHPRHLERVHQMHTRQHRQQGQKASAEAAELRTAAEAVVEATEGEQAGMQEEWPAGEAAATGSAAEVVGQVAEAVP